MQNRLPLILLLSLASSHLCPGQWPQWRGPSADGTWQCPGLALKIENPQRIWKKEISGGYSGITVSGGRAYTMDRPDKKNIERILCLDAKTGKPLWEYSYAASYKGLSYDSGPRASVTIRDQKAYALGSVGHIHCLDAGTGKVIWSKDSVKQLGARRPTWGFAASPVIWKNTVIYQVGTQDGGYVAFDKNSGKELWRGSDDPAGYATPVFTRHRGRDLMLAWTPEHIRGMSPDTGKVLWSVPYKIKYGVSIAMPIFHDETVLVCGYWHGSRAIKLGKSPTDATLLWQDEENIRGLMAQPLYRDGLVYLLDRSNGLCCFELTTGKRLWNDANNHAITPADKNPQSTMVWARDGKRNDRALVLNANGELLSITIGREGFRIHSRAQVIGKTWAHPAYARGHIFARSDREIVCLKLEE
jgi:outer membrane protein assembly factor BamB